MFQKLKKNFFQFDEKIEKRDAKTIELMGLFTAIIAFIMASIPTFKYMENIFDVGIFFVVFATSLISFLLFLLIGIILPSVIINSSNLKQVTNS